MSHYRASFVVPNSIEHAFDFVSDFRNSSKWDPRVREARKVTDGPIGLNTTYELVSPLALTTTTMPYTITTYDRPRCLILHGENRIMSYRDEITFAELGGGTEVTYDAELSLRSIFMLGTPILALSFKRIGDDATRGIKRALEQAARAEPS